MISLVKIVSFFVKNKNYIISALMLIVFVFLIVSLFMSNRNLNQFKSQSDRLLELERQKIKQYESLVKEIERENQFLINQRDSIYTELTKLSIEKQKVKIVYENKFKEVDNKSAIDIVSEFERILSKSSN